MWGEMNPPRYTAEQMPSGMQGKVENANPSYIYHRAEYNWKSRDTLPYILQSRIQSVIERDPFHVYSEIERNPTYIYFRTLTFEEDRENVRRGSGSVFRECFELR